MCTHKHINTEADTGTQAHEHRNTHVHTFRMRIHHQFEIFTWRAVHLEINSGGLAKLDANRLVYLCVFVNVSCAHALHI